jgi:hypothetical protein
MRLSCVSFGASAQAVAAVAAGAAAHIRNGVVLVAGNAVVLAVSVHARGLDYVGKPELGVEAEVLFGVVVAC